MDTAQIEQKLARRPNSPLFARLADAYVRDGRTGPAKELLLAGLEKYPAYPAPLPTEPHTPMPCPA